MLLPLLLLLLSASNSLATPLSLGPELMYKPNSCPRVAYNPLYAAYELRLPLLVDASRWSHEGRLESLRASGDAAMKRSGLTVVAGTDSSHGAWVSLLCSSYQRCYQLLTQATGDPQTLATSLTFNAVGYDGKRRVASRSTPAMLEAGARLVGKSCNSGWVVFQQRVDGSLSFRQNYATYARGFGRPGGNYWMGLENLHHSLRAGLGYLPCRMRMETTSIGGSKYWGEWAHFYVEGASNGYRLRVAGRVSGSRIPAGSWTYVNGMRFTTYDRDRDAWKGQCSRHFGYGGFWYRKCHYINLNGEYPNRGDPNNAVFSCINMRGKRGYVRMVKTKMMFKCSPGKSQ